MFVSLWKSLSFRNNFLEFSVAECWFLTSFLKECFTAMLWDVFFFQPEKHNQYKILYFKRKNIYNSTETPKWVESIKKAWHKMAAKVHLSTVKCQLSHIYQLPRAIGLKVFECWFLTSFKECYITMLRMFFVLGC